ncbi:HD domain-containing phosphohydrolase [Treponema zioleckii]|uniref:HD domain-containing phosphohydrolase n=1 Tax=Treponema zioleckii TaxID=331680 RepID=UPI00168B8538|nr:HD domain-containing phosphohydrolase [Treponema zioleckii]
MKKNSKELSNGNLFFFIFSQIIVILALFCIFFVSFAHFYRIAKKDAISIGEKNLYEASEEINGFLNGCVEFLNGIETSVNHMAIKKVPSETLQEYFSYVTAECKNRLNDASYGLYGYIGGEYFDGLDWIPDEKFVPTDREWYKAAKSAGGKTVICQPYLDAMTHHIIISVSCLLADGESVLAMDISMNSLQEYAKNLNLEMNGTVFIVDKSGQILVHSDSLERGKNYLLRGYNSEEKALTEKIFSAENGIFEQNHKGRDCLIISQKIFDDWRIALIVDKMQVFRNLQVTFWLAMGSLVFVMIFIFYLSFSNFQTRNKVSKYARILRDYKNQLELKVSEQVSQLHNQTQALVKIQESVIDGMATLIEYRDANTGLHVQNTKNYALMISKYLYDHGLHKDEVDERFLSMIGNAAAMHDIGKISISDSILNKRGKLTEEEFEIMKTHTSVGSLLVRQVFGDSIEPDMLRMCIDVVLYHHEKWDGCGYPFGFSGTQIPLSARILAIADCFDAIASKRIYKEAVPVEEVFVIIEKESGTHFDPELAKIFLGMREEIIAYLQKVKDEQNNGAPKVQKSALGNVALNPKKGDASGDAVSVDEVEELEPV